MNLENTLSLLSLTVAVFNLAIVLLDRAAAKRKPRRKKR
jgi:hypothetical protein